MRQSVHLSTHPFIMTPGPSLTEFLIPYQLYADPAKRLLLRGQSQYGLPCGPSSDTSAIISGGAWHIDDSASVSPSRYLPRSPSHLSPSRQLDPSTRISTTTPDFRKPVFVTWIQLPSVSIPHHQPVPHNASYRWEVCLGPARLADREGRVVTTLDGSVAEWRWR
jgi:hypothetical protein